MDIVDGCCGLCCVGATAFDGGFDDGVGLGEAEGDEGDEGEDDDDDEDGDYFEYGFHAGSCWGEGL